MLIHNNHDTEEILDNEDVPLKQSNKVNQMTITHIAFNLETLSHANWWWNVPHLTSSWSDVQVRDDIGKSLKTSLISTFMQYQLHSIIFWTSILEISVFMTLLIVFFASDAKLGIIWLTIFHLPRGILGFCLLKFLPRSHEIVEDLDFDDIQGNLTIEKLYERIKFSLSVQFMNQAQASRFWMMGYSIITAICYLFDGICFIYAFK